MNIYRNRKTLTLGRMLAVCVILLLAFPAQAQPLEGPQASWIETDPLPTAVGFYGAAQCPGEPDEYYVLGGAVASSSPVNNFQHYDVASNNWTSLANLPTALLGSAAVCYGGHIYLAGGHNGTTRTRLFYIYDIATNIWSSGADLPRNVFGTALGAWDGKLYLVGGTPNNYPWAPVNQVDRYDIASNTWSTLPAALMPKASGFAGSVQTGRYLYVVGGWSGDFNANINVTLRLDMATETWEQGPTFTSRRAALALPATQGHLYAVGGDANGLGDTNPTNLVETLDLSTWPLGTWTASGDSLPANIGGNNGSFCSEAVAGGEVWSVGGVELKLSQPVVTDTVTYLAAEPCFQQFYQVSMSSDTTALDSFAGQTVSYTLTVDNSGHISDTYTVTVTSTWPTVYPSQVGPLKPGEMASLSVEVQIPLGAADDAFDSCHG